VRSAIGVAITDDTQSRVLTWLAAEMVMRGEDCVVGVASADVEVRTTN